MSDINYNNFGCKFLRTVNHSSDLKLLGSVRNLSRTLICASAFLFLFSHSSSFTHPFSVKSSNIHENLTRALAHDRKKARVLVIGALPGTPRGWKPVTRRDFFEKTILDFALARQIGRDSLYLRFSTRHYAPPIIHVCARII